MPELSWALTRNAIAHFHPALVHFPVALVLTGAGLETWRAIRRQDASETARVLLVLGLAGALGAVLSGLSLFHAEDYRDRTLVAISIHRVLGLTVVPALTLAAVANGLPGRGELVGARLVLYRVAYGVSGLLVGLAGHYGGWVVFGWGSIWTSF